MDYIDSSLGGRETVLLRGRFPTVYWVAAWATLLLLGIFVIGIVLFAMMAIHMTTTKLAVTTERVVLKRGLVRRSTQELAIGSVESVELRQSILGRLFGYARLVVRGTGEGQLAFPNMAEPIAFRRAIETSRERARAVHFDPSGARQLKAAAGR